MLGFNRQVQKQREQGIGDKKKEELRSLLSILSIRVTRFGIKAVFSCLMVLILSLSLTSCGNSLGNKLASGIETATGSQSSQTRLTKKLTEVAPPNVIQQLRQSLDPYRPQVTIVSPQVDEVLENTTVSVKLQVQDLPTFKNTDLGMGPHLHLILDNQPYQAVYNPEEPITLENLDPGTHTLRVFASRPWHESFKNEGAYAQATFHIFTKTTRNHPDTALPLLTYSRPKGQYGAEPIMLDFYLTDAPLHLVAQESPEDNIVDWRVRVTINGQSFFLDNWLPIYLKGFKKGDNWVELEFLDEQGNLVDNEFNNTVRVINYQPKGQDTLSKLVRGEISFSEARGIVEEETPILETEPLVEEEFIEEEETEEIEEAPAEVETTAEENIEEETPVEEENVTLEVEEVTTEEEIIIQEEIPAEEEDITPEVEEVTTEEENVTPEVEEETTTDEETLSPTIEEEVSLEKPEETIEELNLEPENSEIESSLEETS